jgi:hypothetical protein
MSDAKTTSATQHYRQDPRQRGREAYGAPDAANRERYVFFQESVSVGEKCDFIMLPP